MDINTEKKTCSDIQIPWYMEEGNDLDVVLSSRCRAIRNLINFPFPKYFKNDDEKRVVDLVLDVFTTAKDPFSFWSVQMQSLSMANKAVLEERGILKSLLQRQKENLICPTAIVMESKGKIWASINAEDHLRLFAFSSGLDFLSCFEQISAVDMILQEKLQFASTYDFGYLCSKLTDSGSGLKFSVRVHLPSIVHFGKLSAIFDYVHERGFDIKRAFLPFDSLMDENAFFLISSKNAMEGTEYDQVALAQSVCKYIVNSERKIFETFADNKSTVLRNCIIHSFTKAKFSLLLSMADALKIISDMMFALKLGILSGISFAKLNELLYKIQDGNLSFLFESGSFAFEEDVQNDRNLKIQRLRALMLQEAFESITLGNI